jgi:hypothetical protein
VKSYLLRPSEPNAWLPTTLKAEACDHSAHAPGIEPANVGPRRGNLACEPGSASKTPSGARRRDPAQGATRPEPGAATPPAPRPEPEDEGRQEGTPVRLPVSPAAISEGDEGVAIGWRVESIDRPPRSTTRGTGALPSCLAEVSWSRWCQKVLGHATPAVTTQSSLRPQVTGPGKSDPVKGRQVSPGPHSRGLLE